MHSTWIKICGTMRPEDAAAAARLGADAVGMIFQPSAPRYISRDIARDIVTAAPESVLTVGVFVDADADRIRDTVADVGLRAVQFNGSETPEFVAQLAPVQVIKSVRVDPETFADDLAQWRTGFPNLFGIVLETASNLPGGTGIPNNWDLVAQVQRSGAFDGIPRVIAAGGLTPENVGDVVRQIRPFGVDVSSGVEAKRGQKSADKIAQFIHNVRAADQDRS